MVLGKKFYRINKLVYTQVLAKNTDDHLGCSVSSHVML